MDASRPVTVRELCSATDFRDFEILAGEAGAGRSIEDVLLIAGSRLVPGRQHGLYVLDGSILEKDSYQVDVSLRAVVDAGGHALVVVAPPSEIGLASSRLADKFGIPLIQVHDQHPLVVVDRVRQFSLGHREVLATIVLSAVGRLQKSLGVGLNGVIAETAQLLSADVGLLSSEGHVVAGSRPQRPLTAADRIGQPMVTRAGTTARTVVPVSLAPQERPNLWLFADSDAAPPSWEVASTYVLQVSAWAVGSTLAAERLQQERAARARSETLDLVLAARDDDDPVLNAQLAVLGWRMDGWCTGVHVRLLDAEHHSRILGLTGELTRELAAQQLTATVVERPDGWSFWMVSSKEPPVSSFLPLRRVVHTALTCFIANRGLRCRAGVGRPYRGLEGLQLSLSEARDAMTIAAGEPGDVAVQHIDELGMRQVLFGWYSSHRSAEIAEAILEPLRIGDASGALRQTLECYLDNESSSTRVAEVLGLHRNTVIKRIDRVRSLLGVDLEDADNRLALQLAFRVSRCDSV